MAQVPVVWDETRLLSGYPGESFVVARRSGERWYVAGLNGENEAREMLIVPDFLPEGRLDVTVFADGASPKEIAVTHRIDHRMLRIHLITIFIVNRIFQHPQPGDDRFLVFPAKKITAHMPSAKHQIKIIESLHRISLRA